MKTEAALAHFGSQTRIAKALGISQAAVSKWGEEVPFLRACQIQILTKGKLKACPNSSAAQKTGNVAG